MAKFFTLKFPQTAYFADLKQLLSLIILCPILLAAQPAERPQWQWLQKIEGELCESITASCINHNDELIVTGVHENRADAVFTSSGGKSTVVKGDTGNRHFSCSRYFLAKYDTLGRLIWEIGNGGSSDIHAWTIHCDRNNNIIVGGNFRGTIELKSRNGKSQTLQAARFADYQTPGGALNYFLAKYDTHGNLLWSKVGLCNANSYANQIETDAKNNIYVKAYCTSNAISFNDYTLVAGPFSEHGYVYNFTYILLKYNPNGNEEWISYGGDFNAYNFRVTDSGIVTIGICRSGEFKVWNTNGKIYKFPAKNTLVYEDIILDKNGNISKVTEAYSTLKDFRISKRIADPQGNIYSLITPNVNYGMGIHSKTQIGNQVFISRRNDVYLVKTDALYQPLWVAKISGQDEDKPIDLELDKNFQPYITAHYWWSTTVCGATGDSVKLNSHQNSMILVSYNSEGKLNWVEEAGRINIAKNYDAFCHIQFTSRNQLVLAGTIGHPSDFGNLKADIKGPLEWAYRNKPVTNPDLVRWDFTDAFITLGSNQPLRNQTNKVDTAWNPNPIAIGIKPVKNQYSDTLASVKYDSSQMYQPNPPAKNPKQDPIAEVNPIQIQLFPNPVQGNEHSITLRIIAPESGSFNLEIHNQNGKIMGQIREKIGAGENIQKINLADYVPGLYYFTITIAKNKWVKRVVVL